jgi:hypothetical protein
LFTLLADHDDAAAAAAAAQRQSDADWTRKEDAL